jgi:hypothetical protein
MLLITVFVERIRVKYFQKKKIDDEPDRLRATEVLWSIQQVAAKGLLRL